MDKSANSLEPVEVKGDGQGHVEFAEQFDGAFSGQAPATAEEKASVRRRIDWQLMPVMIVTYAIQYYDKTVLNQASLFGILKDLGLSEIIATEPKLIVSTTKYSYVSFVFYCGYILGVYPATLLAQKYRAGKACAMLVMVWGVVEVLTVVCSTFGGMMAQRFFLGFCEAGIAPAFVITCSQWYTAKESALRIAIWWASNGAVAMIGPLISYGFGSIHGALAGWKNIYLFAGLLTFAWGFFVLWRLPDDPLTAKFLDVRGRFVALERTRENNNGLVNHTFEWSQIREALSDPGVWLLTTCMFGIVTSNAITGTFASLIIKNLGFGTLDSLLLQIPTGFFGLCCGIIPAILVVKTNKWRLVIVSAFTCLSLCGTVILYTAPRHKTGALLVGYYLNNFYVGCPGLLLATVAANIAGHTKKSTSSSMVFVGYCSGSIMGPLIFKAQDQYHTGFLGIIVCQVYVIIAAQVLRGLYSRRNEQRDAKYGAQRMHEPFSDKTDVQNNNFRYAS